MIHGFAESEDFNAKIENGKNSQEKNYLIGKFDKKKTRQKNIRLQYAKIEDNNSYNLWTFESRALPDVVGELPYILS